MFCRNSGVTPSMRGISMASWNDRSGSGSSGTWSKDPPRVGEQEPADRTGLAVLLQRDPEVCHVLAGAAAVDAQVDLPGGTGSMKYTSTLRTERSSAACARTRYPATSPP